MYQASKSITSLVKHCCGRTASVCVACRYSGMCLLVLRKDKVPDGFVRCVRALSASCGRVVGGCVRGTDPTMRSRSCIVNLSIFWGFFSARTGSSVHFGLSRPPRPRVRFHLPVFTHFLMGRLHLLITRATPEFVHLPPRFACRKSNDTALNLCDGTSAPSPLCALQSVRCSEFQRRRATWTFSSQIHLN